ncbi:MAG: BNR-4 repeat-containing protein [Chitinophagaceae bacterium]|nr:BNR-4 repeat-containing protein [Chitinophagaceae bacterium]
MVEVDSGWAANSVNTVVFRKNSIVTHGRTQYIAYYNQEGFVVIGKRRGDRSWQLKTTRYRGKVTDAHNSISIMVDDAGYLHMAWDHHNDKLNYCKSIAPGSLELGEKITMTGLNESSVSYPEFYKLRNGKLLFLYRDGQSGGGNLVVNLYDLRKGKWEQLHANLIDGEGRRNAYWQACVDNKGQVHISWVWRETPDVASNHDLGYARSDDDGLTWKRSNGSQYQLPMTAGSAEYAAMIPQRSELINQTSMTTDEQDRPLIAGYWKRKEDAAPQYRVVYFTGNEWKEIVLGFRTTDFSLSGAGTKRIPISRPQLIAWHQGKRNCFAVVFRDEERGNRPSAAICTNIENPRWKVVDLSAMNLGSWEPSYDTELWRKKNTLNLFLQGTDQADAEGKSSLPAQMISVLEWKP